MAPPPPHSPAYDPRRDVSRADAQPFLWRGGATACLLVHGFTSTPFEVREMGERLHAEGCTVQGLLLPGHGSRVEDLFPMRWQRWTEAVATAAADLRRDHETLVLIGSSLGGALCLWESLSGRADGVVTLGLPLLVPWWQRAAPWLGWVRPLLPKKGGNSSLRDPEARARHPSYGAMPLRTVGQMNALLDALRHRLPEIRTPALLIHAREDSTAAPASSIAAYEGLGSSQKSLVWVENSDHILLEDYDKQMVFETICQFVQEIEGARCHVG